MSDLGVVQLLYKVLRHLPLSYSLYTHTLREMFVSDFVELYKSVQELYENAFHCRLFAMAR